MVCNLWIPPWPKAGKARDMSTPSGIFGLSLRSTLRILPDSWQRKSDVYEELSEHLPSGYVKIAIENGNL